MIEIELVKKYFELKKIVWVRGPEGSRKPQIVQELFSEMKVEDKQVKWVTAHQFVDMIERGTIRVFSRPFRALVISGFDGLNEEQNERFFRALVCYFDFKDSLSFSLFLISTQLFRNIFEFEMALKPVVINIPGVGDDPSDLNERVHAALESASRVAQKKVTRITDEAAIWLETQTWSGNDDELLVLFVLALLKMGDGTVLGVRHLLTVIEHFEDKSAKNNIKGYSLNAGQ